MKRMLINATQAEERRLAIVDGQKLLDYEIEIEGREQRKGNIYKAEVTRVEPSLEACFVDYGEERHGFLPFKEISKQYFAAGISPGQAKISDVISEGDELIVQVEKEERGNKGAALTTFISLAGRYVVLMPNNPRGGGVSRRIEGEDRAELKEAMDQLDYPNGMSIIARTAGIGRTSSELQWDLNYLLKLWNAIDLAAKNNQGSFLIHQESSLVIRAIRDYFNHEIGDILIDTDDIFEQAQQFMTHVMPEYAQRVKRYRDDAPLFSRFQIEHQIESAYARTVFLPSGGAIVIDHTEALVSIDVNSARAIKGGDIEETATRTNLEAADEVARQMRLRDLGGLIVIDFIDMDESKNRREVENRLREALRQDRARVQFGAISKFGLMEMSRQRLKPALSEGSSIPCPRCGGSGHIRDTESSALQILRIIQEESMKDNSAAVHAQVPVEVASFLLNEKRSELTKIEHKQRINVLLIPNKNLEIPHYKLERIKSDDPRLDQIQASYKMIEEIEDTALVTRKTPESVHRQTPMIKGVLPDAPAPVSVPKPERTNAASASKSSKTQAQSTPSATTTEANKPKGFIAWIKNLFGIETKPETASAPAAQTTPSNETNRENPRGKDNRRHERGSRQNANSERSSENRANRRSERGERGERNERNADSKNNRNERGERNEQRNERNETDSTSNASNTRSNNASNNNRNENREPREPRSSARNERNERAPRDNNLPQAQSHENATQNVAKSVYSSRALQASNPESNANQGDDATKNKANATRTNDHLVNAAQAPTQIQTSKPSANATLSDAKSFENQQAANDSNRNSNLSISQSSSLAADLGASKTQAEAQTQTHILIETATQISTKMPEKTVEKTSATSIETSAETFINVQTEFRETRENETNAQNISTKVESQIDNLAHENSVASVSSNAISSDFEQNYQPIVLDEFTLNSDAAPNNYRDMQQMRDENRPRRSRDRYGRDRRDRNGNRNNNQRPSTDDASFGNGYAPAFFDADSADGNVATLTFVPIEKLLQNDVSRYADSMARSAPLFVSDDKTEKTKEQNNANPNEKDDAANAQAIPAILSTQNAQNNQTDSDSSLKESQSIEQSTSAIAKETAQALETNAKSPFDESQTEQKIESSIQVQVQSIDVSNASEVFDAAISSVLPTSETNENRSGFVLPIDQLREVAQNSGLEWIQTDAQKAMAAQLSIASEPQLTRIPRLRPEMIHLQETDLVLVETRRDLQTLVLPFEKQT